MKNTYKNACIQHIIDTLPDWKGQEVEASELGYLLTEGENANGSWYCSTYKAQQDLQAWFDDVAEFIEEYTSEFGEKPHHDAFTQPELFHCLMMIHGVEKIVNELDVVSDNWNQTITIDQELIDQAIEALEDMQS